MLSRGRIGAALLVGSLAGVSLAQSPRLGPADGADLRPDDLERVQVGDVAPDFTLESTSGRRVTLSGFRGSRFVVLTFYRGHW